MAKTPVSVSKFLPPNDAGRTALERLAATFRAANEIAPDRGGLSVLPKMLRLNFGKIEVLTVDPDASDCSSTTRSFRTRRPSGRGASCSKASQILRRVSYRSVRGSVICGVLPIACKDLSDCLADLEQAHLRLLRRAGLTTQNPMTKKSHSVLAIEQISDFLGSPVPQPKYVT